MQKEMEKMEKLRLKNKVNKLLSEIDYFKSRIHCNESIFGDEFSSLLELYTKKMKENNAIDYNDMLLLVDNAMKNDRTILVNLRNRFKYVFVDEYQVKF